MGQNIRLLFLGCCIACLLISSACATSPEAEAQWNISYHLLLEGKYHLALDASEKAIALDPQFAKAWNAKGTALHNLGRNDEALEAFTKAVELDPTLEIAKQNIAHVQLDLQTGAPLTTLSEAEVQWKISYNLMLEGNCSPALDASERAIALDPQFARAWNIKGLALHCLGRNDEALEAFTKAVELDPTLEVARENIAHVQREMQNRTPLTTPPVILPVFRNKSIRYDGELGYEPAGKLTGCWAFLHKGHAVLYSNNKTIIVTGVRVAGCRYGDNDAKVRIEIWDKNLTTLYHDVIPYEKIPFNTTMPGQSCERDSSWIDIGLPDHEVRGDFYIVIFTDSYSISDKEHGIYILYYTPSETGTSSIVLPNPNRIDNSTIGKQNYKAGEFDWMVHVLYTNPPHPGEGVSSPDISGTETAGSGQAPVPTKSPVEEGLVITGLVFGALYRRMRR
ncbi:MAG: tetratricopeptide repeat protein [Methanoregula sp.]|nr:MAG: tetratricopeptide repeat protein [Methanoregula sp.]